MNTIFKRSSFVLATLPFFLSLGHSTAGQEATTSDPKNANAGPAAGDANATAKNAGETVVDEEAIVVPRMPKQWNDVAFNQYVDINLLRRALSRNNPKLLTDVALQFAEGERVLQRSHKAVKADKLLSMAVNLAADKQHKPSLIRLGRAAEMLGKKQLVVVIHALENPATTRSASTSDLSIDIQETTPEALAELQSIIHQIDNVKLIGDREALAEISDLVAASTLTTMQKDGLTKKIQDILKDLPAEADPQARLLSMLADSSRSTTTSDGSRSAMLGSGGQQIEAKIDLLSDGSRSVVLNTEGPQQTGDSLAANAWTDESSTGISAGLAFMISNESAQAWNDPAFNRRVDLDLLMQAMESLDAQLLTDCALDFVEAERVLLRSHKSIPAEDLVKRAVDLAAQTKNKESLNRLAKAAEQLGNKQLGTMVKGALMLADEQRSIIPGLVITAASITPVDLEEYQSLLSDIGQAKLFGDLEMLASVKQRAEKIELPEAQKNHIAKTVEETKAAMPEEDRAAAALQFLKSASRAAQQAFELEANYNGRRIRATAKINSGNLTVTYPNNDQFYFRRNASNGEPSGYHVYEPDNYVDEWIAWPISGSGVLMKFDTISGWYDSQTTIRKTGGGGRGGAGGGGGDISGRWIADYADGSQDVYNFSGRGNYSFVEKDSAGYNVDDDAGTGQMKNNNTFMILNSNHYGDSYYNIEWHNGNSITLHEVDNRGNRIGNSTNYVRK